MADTAHLQLAAASESAERLIDALQNARHIALVTHRGPDGDAIGSVIGMKHLLRIARPELEVTMVCCDPVPKSFRFMAGADEFVREVPLRQVDMILVLDVATSGQTGLEIVQPDLFDPERRPPMYVIDHHVSNTRFGDVHLVIPAAASTTVVLTLLAKQWGWRINATAATCLLTGLMTDTGSLQHSSTTSETMRIASCLMEKGGRMGEITREIFKRNSLHTLKLWGRILDRAEITEDNIVMSYVKQQDIDAVGASSTDTAGVIDYLNMVPNAAYTVLLSERNGMVKGSLRTQHDHIDVNEVASQVGGGGHPKAAGFTVPGKLITRHQYLIEDVMKRPQV